MEEQLSIIKEKSKDHWLELISENNDYHIIAKWDGCVHLYRAFNGTDAGDENNDDKCYIHICDVDKFVGLLQEVKQKAQEWYKNGYWD